MMCEENPWSCHAENSSNIDEYIFYTDLLIFQQIYRNLQVFTVCSTTRRVVEAFPTHRGTWMNIFVLQYTVPQSGHTR